MGAFAVTACSDTSWLAGVLVADRAHPCISSGGKSAALSQVPSTSRDGLLLAASDAPAAHAPDHPDCKQSS